MTETAPDIFPPYFADAWGDDRFGLWAEFTIVTAHGSATQRLRWIEPGSFWMGSPDDEPERLDREGPRHRVSLTQGFWLADSACTQALWQAAMGNNPSHFQGDAQRPVERVSWNEVQDFLRRLENLLPGCRADLPSEAQWEYACRAGTDTPFSFGAQIGPEQVNYNGNFPYAAGEKGLNRTQTVAVKSLPPNAWGLYGMHGNVLEWCADGQRAYTADAQQDPRGDESAEAHRAVRGGAWYDIRREGAFGLPHRLPARQCPPQPGFSLVPEVHRAQSSRGRRDDGRGSAPASGRGGRVNGGVRYALQKSALAGRLCGAALRRRRKWICR